jgi:hypothetical protein
MWRLSVGMIEKYDHHAFFEEFTVISPVTHLEVHVKLIATRETQYNPFLRGDLL